jgi:hypothetical protein
LRWFIASTFLLGLTACQHDASQIQEYPRHWPAPVVATDGRCQSIAGTYQYRGEWAPPLANGTPPKFNDFVRLPSILGAPQTVRLGYNEEDGQVSAYIHGAGLTWPSWEAARRDGVGPPVPEVLIPNKEVLVRWSGFNCRDAWVSQTRTRDGGGNGESGTFYGKIVVRLAHGEDGSLIAEVVDDVQNFQLFGAIENDFHSRIWARFPQVDAAERK